MSTTADMLASAKGQAATAREVWPDDADGALDLEHAIELLGRCISALEAHEERVMEATYGGS